MKHTRSHHQGFTLIEILIAMMLSGIMTTIALTQLTLSQQQFSFQEANARIDENARYALEILTEHIRMASYSEDGDDAPTGQFFNGICRDDTSAQNINPCTADNNNGNADNIINDTDHIAVWVNPTDDVSCTGANILGNTIVNVFYIDQRNNFNNLICRSFNANGDTNTTENQDTQPIIEGIEDMQILYGLNDGTNNIPQRYVSANIISAMPMTDPTPWSRISAVRITLLVGTGYNDNADTVNSRIYQLADKAPVTYTDGNRRKIYSTTVAINNAVL